MKAKKFHNALSINVVVLFYKSGRARKVENLNKVSYIAYKNKHFENSM